MRTDNIQVSFVMSVPCDKPDKNGVLHSSEAIQNALSSSTFPLPIKICSNNGDSMIIGNTTCNPYAIQYDKKENITRFTVDGVIYFGGMECFVREINGNGTIADFEIASFGFSE